MNLDSLNLSRCVNTETAEFVAILCYKLRVRPSGLDEVKIKGGADLALDPVCAEHISDETGEGIYLSFWSSYSDAEQFSSRVANDTSVLFEGSHCLQDYSLHIARIRCSKEWHQE